jgi:hypothetical protein
MGFAGAALLFKRNLAYLRDSVTQNIPRYRYPIFWISFLLAGHALVRLCGAVSSQIKQ